MSENKTPKKSPFSIYWIYGFIAIAIIGFQFFMSSSGSNKVELESTFFELAKQEFVTDVTLINGIRVDFVLNEDGMKFIETSGEERFREMNESLKSSNNRMGSSKKFSVEIIDKGDFNLQARQLNAELKAEGKKPFALKKDVEHDYFGEILRFFLPIIILIAIFMFVMRKMSGGAGGGAGGQIFNIGKSKLKFMKTESNKYTFRRCCRTRRRKRRSSRNR